MKLLACCGLLLAVASPAFAQEASPKIDWTKPVIIDPNRLTPRAEDTPTVVEVYTIEDLKAPGSTSVTDFVHSLQLNQPATLPERDDPAHKNGAGGSSDPLANYSPEMREKLSRYLPKPEEERQQ